MKFIFASLVWVVMAAVIGAGIWLVAAKGNPWLLVASVVVFLFAVGKIGCATH